MEVIKIKIRAYLARFFPESTLQDQDDIFSLGFVNSLFALQLVNFLEHEFIIEIENEDLDLGNFRSVHAMSGFIERKRGASPIERGG